MKRAIALLLSLMFVFALIPASALADNEINVTLPNGGTIYTVGADGTKTKETDGKVATGANIEIVAEDKSATNLIFTGWTGSATSSDRQVSFDNITEDISVSANYVSGYKLGVDPDAASISTTGVNTIGSKWQTTPLVASGATVTVTGASLFKSWDNTGTTPASILPTDLTQNSFTFTMPGSAVTIAAVTMQEYTVTDGTLGGAALAYAVDGAPVASGGKVLEGKTVQVTVTDPAAGGYVTDLTVGGTTVPVDRVNKTASFTMPEANVTVTPVIKYKVTLTVDGETKDEFYLAGSESKAISAPAVTGDGKEFKEWTITPSTGSVASATAHDTTYTMGDRDTTVAATYTSQYVLSYEDDSVAATAYKEGASVTLVKGGGAFVEWKFYKEDGTEIAATTLGLSGDTIKMPAYNVKVEGVYNCTLTATNAYVYYYNAKAQKLGSLYIDPTGKPDTAISAVIPSGTHLCVKPYNTGDGRTFSQWSANSRRITSQNKANPLYFRMPAENVKLWQSFVTYRLTLVNAIDINGVTVEALNAKANGTSYKEGYGTTLHWDSYPGAYATFKADDAPGGTKFTGWTATSGYNYYTTTNASSAPATGSNGTHVTVQMPGTSSHTVTANYASQTVDALAYIQVRQEPSKLNYTVGSSFDPTGCEVYYYAPYRNSLGQLTDENGNVVSKAVFKPGELVSMANLRFTVVTLEGVASVAYAPFTTAGDYALWVQMVVNGTVMAQLLCFNDQLVNCIHVYNFIPSYVKIVQPVPTNYTPWKTMFYGQPFSKDALDVWVYGEGRTGSYMQVGVLNWNDYAFEPVNIPTKAALDAAYTGDNAWLKKQADGNYWINLGHFLSYYYTNDTGKTKLPCLNEITPDGATPEGVWISLVDGATAFEVKSISSTAGEVATTNLASGVYTAWTIKTIGTSAVGRRLTLDVTAAGLTDAQKAQAISYGNSDSSIAYLRQDDANPLVYYLIPCGTGTTSLTFYRSSVGADDPLKKVITVTVDAGGASFDDMESFTLNNDSNYDPATGGYSSVLPLYVSNKSAQYVKTYSPATADTRVVWSISFLDGKSPTDVENYVSINETSGEVTALKFTDRLILVTASAVNGSPACADRYCVIQLAEVGVDGITLDETSLTMYQFSSYQLNPTITPAGASDQTVIWTSSLSNVVSVSSDGVLTANGLGTATIKGTSQNNSKVTCTLTVTVQKATLLTGLKLSKNAVSMGVGETNTLSVTYTPATATTRAVNWTTSDASVVTVSNKGKLRGISEGSAIVTATANDGSGLKVQCVVSVTRLVVSAITLNKQLLSIYTEDEVQMTETVYPTNASNQVVDWTSSNEKVATVDPDGIITGIGAGNCVITATATDGSTKYADCVVVVTKRVPVTGLSLNASSFDLLYNDTAQLAATVAPSDATYDKITWTTSDEKIVSVSETGKIGGVGTGSAVITATAGGKSISITVSVVTKMYSVGTVIRCARRVNVRQNASGTSAFVGYAYLGDTFRVVEKTGSWYKIQYNATTQAYIWSYYLNAQETGKQYVSAGAVYAGTPTPTGSAATTSTLTIVNCTNCINVRSGAATTYKKLGYAFLNEKFVYTGKTTDGAWFIIEYGDQVGYVSANFVKVN